MIRFIRDPEPHLQNHLTESASTCAKYRQVGYTLWLQDKIMPSLSRIIFLIQLVWGGDMFHTCKSLSYFFWVNIDRAAPAAQI